MKVTPKLKRKSIVLSYKLNNVLYEVYTGVSVEPERWSTSKKLIKGEGEVIAEKNAKIKRYSQEIELFVLQLQRLGKEYFHSELKEHLKNLDVVKSNPGSASDFVAFFDEFIRGKEVEFAESTLKGYKTTKRHFSEFIQSKGKRSIAFESVTARLLKEFTKYLDKSAYLSPATRGKHIKNIKVVMGEALSEGLHENRDFKEAKKDNENSPNIYLNYNEIQELLFFKEYTLEESKMMDAFIFICLTGLRFNDYNTLKPHNVSKKLIEGKEIWFLSFNQDKTNEEVETPVMYKEAVEILRKYDNKLPKYANAYMNRYVKEILKKHKLLENKIQLNKEKINGEFLKRELITIHTGRRSFCTNQYLNGTPSQFIMAASGHKTESAFRLYIKADQLDKAKGLINYINY